MAVNNSGLALGDFPFAPKVFSSWYDCWSTLRSQGQLGRGSTMFSRHYYGPVIRNGEEIVPGDYYFGPVHPPGLGLTDPTDPKKTQLKK